MAWKRNCRLLSTYPVNVYIYFIREKVAYVMLHQCFSACEAVVMVRSRVILHQCFHACKAVVMVRSRVILHQCFPACEAVVMVRSRVRFTGSRHTKDFKSGSNGFPPWCSGIKG